MDNSLIESIRVVRAGRIPGLQCPTRKGCPLQSLFGILYKLTHEDNDHVSHGGFFDGTDSFESVLGTLRHTLNVERSPVLWSGLVSWCLADGGFDTHSDSVWWRIFSRRGRVREAAREMSDSLDNGHPVFVM